MCNIFDNLFHSGNVGMVFVCACFTFALMPMLKHTRIPNVCQYPGCTMPGRYKYCDDHRQVAYAITHERAARENHEMHQTRRQEYFNFPSPCKNCRFEDQCWIIIHQIQNGRTDTEIYCFASSPLYHIWEKEYPLQAQMRVDYVENVV